MSAFAYLVIAIAHALDQVGLTRSMPSSWYERWHAAIRGTIEIARLPGGAIGMRSRARLSRTFGSWPRRSAWRGKCPRTTNHQLPSMGSYRLAWLSYRSCRRNAASSYDETRDRRK